MRYGFVCCAVSLYEEMDMLLNTTQGTDKAGIAISETGQNSLAQVQRWFRFSVFQSYSNRCLQGVRACCWLWQTKR